MTDSGKLKVGRASAGSGKTFTLTLEYLTLLVQNPDNYRHILAVTFTNKATNEMKSRIIETLHKVATNHPSAQIIEDKLHEKTGESAATIRERCQLALSKILHDYSHFRIETIDSFFQSIIRDLARELNLTANLSVDLNSEEALEEAVAQMIERMKKGDDVYRAVLSYVEDNLETEKKSWKIDSEVTKFSKNIFNENYLKEEKNINEQTKAPGFYSNYKKMLYEKRDQIDSERIQNAQKFIDHCDFNCLQPKDFVGGSRGVYAYLPKIAEGRTPKDLPKALRDDPEAPWMKNSDQDATHRPFFMELFEKEQELRRKKNTVETVLQYVNQMGLLSKVDAVLRQLNSEKNRFILADNAHKLNDIISDNDIPFIYEKAASSFRYIMIDEFQDTSELQWKNFKPLIKECIDNGRPSLIVGDVKQSIYRFRNSDWGILNNINTDADFGVSIDEEEMRKALDTNYRSDGQVVDFNNRFFREASNEIASHYESLFGNNGLTKDIKLAYNEVTQKIRKGYEERGYVEVIDVSSQVNQVNKEENQDETQDTDNAHFNEYSNDASPSDSQPKQEKSNRELYRQAVLEQLKDKLIELKDHGVDVSDIAILTRYNKELQFISEYLEQEFKGINIVSSEAYRLDSSEAVQLIISAMRVIANFDRDSYTKEPKPFNMFHCATLAYRYQTIVLHCPCTLEQVCQANADELFSLLPEGFVDKIDELQTLPLYELSERLFSIFQLDRLGDQSSFLFYFMDQVDAYAMDNSSDIDGFLTHWDEHMYSQTIPAGETEGLHMMTIHQSKGLEFHTVIIPFCDWSMEVKNSTIWCRPTDEGQLPVIPMKCQKGINDTDFKDEYEKEVLKNYVDNQNLIYVAFTRASHNLIIMTGNTGKEGDKDKSKDKESAYTLYEVLGNTIGRMKKDSAEMEMDSAGIGKNSADNNIDKEEEGTSLMFQSGTIEQHHASKSGADTVSNIPVKFVNTEQTPVFKQSNQSREFVADEDDSNDDTGAYIKKGLVVHKVFSMITDFSDAPRILRQLDQEGVMEDREFYDDITRFVSEALADATIRQWFSPEWQVLNERDIVTLADGQLQTKRPDRVIFNDHETIVIDYKTGERRPSHQKQVRDYMHQLAGMGMPNVTGYLWYMKDNRVENVEE